MARKQRQNNNNNNQESRSGWEGVTSIPLPSERGLNICNQGSSERLIMWSGNMDALHSEKAWEGVNSYPHQPPSPPSAPYFTSHYKQGQTSTKKKKNKQSTTLPARWLPHIIPVMTFTWIHLRSEPHTLSGLSHVQPYSLVLPPLHPVPVSSHNPSDKKPCSPLLSTKVILSLQSCCTRRTRWHDSCWSYVPQPQ